ncbi:hypothetical protein B7P43_G03103 [Cryptotermes secundus]|uniref:Rho GTPase-activating protein 12 n=1 Tax=Cryptotermes secundus TaxID=105785 RepID=A0A2J7RS15_9NEOP|nr:hypothetical protein B7P43_G03103 [Cryptotermes secundus]PNF43628.1 hypothetical protein B7P43_G03103 [Cryptotermes secundus]
MCCGDPVIVTKCWFENKIYLVHIMSEEDIPDIHLRVLYDFEYTVKDERKIRIQKGEKLFLIKKTNSDWWQVIRSSTEGPFFVPAAYVTEYLCSQSTSKESSQHRKFRRKEGNEIKDSVSSADIKKNSNESLEYENKTGGMNISCPKECKSSRGHIEKQPGTFQNVNQKSSDTDGLNKEDANHILLDKRKSWAVEELVAELSKMRTERNCGESPRSPTSPSTKYDEEGHLHEDSDVTSSSSHINRSSDNILCSSKHALSLKCDKADNSVQRKKRNIQVRSCKGTSEAYSKVCPVPSEGSKSVGQVTRKLSESWEKLEQGIQDVTGSGSLNEPNTCTGSAVDNTKMDSLFSKMKSKLNYSSSFKTKKEMQKVLKRGSGNAVLSTSWEDALSDCKKGKDTVHQDENKLNAGHMLSSSKGNTDLDHHQLKADHSGREMEVSSQGNISQKAGSRHWNLVRHHVFGDKVERVVSGSESEENRDDSVGPDEGSISGLSDNMPLCQSGVSKVYSDISDGAVSDDLLTDSLDKAGEEKGDFPCQLKLQKKRLSLSRKNRVESHDFHRRSFPPSPSPDRKPIRVLNEGWEEYKSSQGRTYYYNCKTHDKSWKPPRRHHQSHESAEIGSVENLRSDTSSPLVEVNGSSGTAYIPVPPGWCEVYDEDSGQLCYVNNTTGVKWFSSNDSEGRVYFFEENSNVSSWTLPDFGNAGCDNPTHPLHPNLSESGEEAKKEAKDDQYVGTDVQLRSGQQECQPESRVQHRMVKAHSMVLADASRKKQTSSKSSSVPRNWPQLWDGNMCVLKEGTLNRTKITENGKKLRKNWAPAHVVLTELFLLFFKDAKTFETMKISHGESASGAAQPEFSIDLNGALLEHGEKASSRRNVFLVTTVLGLQVLLQCENAQQEEEWYKAIHKAIKDLPSAYDASPRNKAAKLNPQHLSSSSPEETKKSSYIGRSRSVKLKVTSKDGSQEDLTASSEESQTKIRNRLKKFFHRRPTKEILVKKGIYKDEPVFGCHLADVCRGESPRVPAFVQHCVAAIECKEENMKTDGLYRASGNLSQVQKIRLQVDQNNLEVLEQEEDVHVLTGALKLFFRELKKPLIPFDHFSKALKASTNPNKKEKLQQFKEIVKALPLPNRDTLEFLLRHLLRVTEYKEFNRMHIPNLAIVFGPTLMWPEAESSNMALDLMQQNLVIECFLQEFYSIFQ